MASPQNVHRISNSGISLPPRTSASSFVANVYQHRVAPFQFADPSKPGHRKIFFFLVNSTFKIPSTSDVPPQHAKWVLDEIAKAPMMQKLPQEPFDVIAEYGVGYSKASN